MSYVEMDRRIDTSAMMSFQLANVKLMEKMNSVVGILGHNLIKLVATPSSKLTEHGDLDGVTLAVKKETPAHLIIDLHRTDLCGAISAYKVKSIKKVTSKEEEEDIRRKFVDYIKNQKTFLDTSMRVISDESRPTVFGEKNSSIIICRHPYMDKEEERLGEEKLIVIRSYHTLFSNILHRSIMDGNLSIDAVFKSPEYKNAYLDGNASRNIIAASVANALGFELEEPYEFETNVKDKPISYSAAYPTFENHYNHLLESHNPPEINVYLHTFNTRESKCILIGRSRDKGFIFVNEPLELKALLFTYPMGIPRQCSRIELSEKMEKMEGIGEGVDPKIIWGSPVGHYKIMKEMYCDYSNNTWIKEWKKAMEQLGYGYKETDYPVTSITSYISSPEETRGSIIEFLKLSKSGDDIIVPISNPFVVQLFPLYLARKKIDPKILLTHLIKGENEHYFTLDKTVLMKILGK